MVNLKKGDLVRFEYTGKVAGTGQVFETTDSQVAKEAGIFDPAEMYGPRLAMFGSGMVMRGLEEALSSMQEGKSEEFKISPDKAFGRKRPDLVRMLSERQFMKQDVRPAPGMLLTLDGVPALVKSVTSGRVVVDFNHPLAGESVVYSVKLHEVIADDGKKIEAVLASVGLQAAISQNGKAYSVAFKKSDSEDKAEAAKQAILRVVPGTTFSVS